MKGLIVMLFVLACGSTVKATEELLQREGFVNIGLAPPSINSEGVVVQLTYWRSTTSKTWNDAYASCRQQGGRLVSPVNPSQDNDLRLHLFIDNFGASIWIGATKNGGSWNWPAHDIPVEYTNWKTPSCGIPSNVCAYTTGALSDGYNWCSTTCGSMLHYVCEV